MNFIQNLKIFNKQLCNSVAHEIQTSNFANDKGISIFTDEEVQNMNYEIIPANSRKESLFENEENIQSVSAMNNRLEALKVLSQSLMREVEALKNNTKSERDVIEDVRDGKIDLEKEVQQFEVELIRCALVRTGGRQRRAAKLLNVKISTLNAKIKRYGIATSGLEFALR